MKASTINKFNKTEKNQKVKAGNCIFPFKYKFQLHNTCYQTDKGDICATEINPKTKTLVKYGYCENLHTIKKKLKTSNIVVKTLKTPKSNSITPEQNLKINSKTNTSKTMEDTKNYREDFIKILEKLKEIHTQKGEHFRARAYSKAQEELYKYSIMQDN